jgi:hypothetical protein
MPQYAVGRDDVLSALRGALEPLDHVQAVWEAGAIAFDPEALAATLRGRVGELRVLFDLFGVLTEKELNRGNIIEAAAFYQSYTLRPLVQALRILHDPTRHNFHTRYVHYDFPEEDVRRLAELFFVADAGELAAKRERAEQWFHELLEAINDGPFTDDIERAALRAKGGENDG